MKNARSLRKALAWIALAAVLLTGCTKASQADITAKSNTERLEDAAVVTLAYTPASQPAQEEVAATPVETVGSTGLRYDEVAVPTSPLYDLLGASTRYSVDLTPKSDIVKIIVDADVYLPNTLEMPTLHVEPRDFTQEEVTKLFNALCGDTVMYKAQEQMTKEEVAERIADVESEMKTARIRTVSKSWSPTWHTGRKITRKLRRPSKNRSATAPWRSASWGSGNTWASIRPWTPTSIRKAIIPMGARPSTSTARPTIKTPSPATISPSAAASGISVIRASGSI